MALTDAQAKYIAASKKKREEEAARKLAADMLANAAKQKTSFPTVTPSKVVKNQVQTPLMSGKPVVSRTPAGTSAPKRTSGSTVLSDYTRSNLLERMTDSRGQLYTPLDIIRYRASQGESAASLAAQARGYDNDDWRENLRKAAEERVARREELDSYVLSEADQQLPVFRQQMIREAKAAWDKAKEEGSIEGVRRAHEKAENVRGWSGYSGGSDGSEYITADLTWDEKRTLNQTGQNKLKKAKLDRQKAWEAKDAKGVQDATRAMAEILSAPGYRANPSDIGRPTDAYGRPMLTSQERLEDAARAMAGAKAIGTGIGGSLLSLAETGNQAMRNYTRDRWGHVLEANANQTRDPALADAARKRLGESTIVDPNLPGQSLMRKSQDYAQEALDGTSGVGRFLGETIISLGQNLPGIAISMIPGAQAAGLALLGAQAAGSKAWELNEQSDQAFLRSLMEGGDPEDYGFVEPGEALLRGILSGGVELLTEKIPLDHLRNILMGKSGQKVMKNILTQMGMEATEEGAAYSANYVLDKMAQDPNAQWTMEEFLKNAAMGAVSGGALATFGSVVGDVPDGRESPVRQAREQASDMPTGDTYTLSRNTQEQTIQEASERPVEGSASKRITVPAKTVKPAQDSPAEEKKAIPKVSLRRVETSQAGMLEEAAQTLGESGRKALMAAAGTAKDPVQYFADFARVYNQALTGTTTSKIQAPASLNDAQVMAASTAGQNDRAANLETAKTAAQYATVAGEEAGLVFDEYVSTSMDRAVADEVNTVARQLGLRVQMADSVAGGSANAEIQGSVVSIEKGNPNPVRFLFGHEMTHRVQELAPESYREFRDFVMQSPDTQEAVQRNLAAYKSKGINLTAEQAMDEIAADYAGQLIEDKQLMSRFIQQNKKKQTLLGRFLEALKDLARKLTGSRKKQADSAVALLEKAVADAAKQARKLPANKNTAQKDGVRYSINEGFAGEIAAWNRNGRPDGETFILGDTGPVLQGLGAIESDIYMEGDKIKKIFKDHPEMGIREIQRIPEILEDPVLVLASRGKGKRGRNTRVVIYGSIKAQNGQPFMAVLDLRPTENGLLLDDMQKVNSSYTKKNAASFVSSSDVMYADEKRTTPLLHQFGLTITSRGLLRSGYIGSITYSGTNVNLSGVPFDQVVGDRARYSIKTDTQGRTLTAEQAEYFKDSQVRDENGNLAVVYHGSREGGFTVFNRNQNYYTDNQAIASSYAPNGELYEGYLNIANPFVIDAEGAKWSAVPVTEEVKEVLDAAGSSTFQEDGAWRTSVADIVGAVEDLVFEGEADYDGVIVRNVDDTGSHYKGEGKNLGTDYITFSSNQFKNVDNRNPTDDPDIRYSLKGASSYAYQKLQEENRTLRERVEYWKGQTKRTQRVTTDKKAVDKAARELVSQYGADIDVAQIRGDLQGLYDYLASGKDGDNDLTYEAARERAVSIAEKLVYNAQAQDDRAYQQYGDLRKFLKETKLAITEADSKAITDYVDFRRDNLRYFNLSKGKHTNVDQVYQEMSERWPEFFDENRESNISDQLYHISDVMAGIYNITAYNPFSSYTREAIAGAANEIMEKFFDLPQTKATFADRQAAQLSREKAKGKQKLQEEREKKNTQLEKLRRENRERVAKALQTERDHREKALAKLKDKHKAKDAAGRERQKARELRRKISRHAKDLSSKLLNPTDKQHIPEDLRKPVAALLDAINQESTYSYDPATMHQVIRKDGRSGGMTGKHLPRGQGSPTIRTQAFEALRKQYQSILDEASPAGDLVVDPDMAAILDRVTSLRDIPIAAMNSGQLDVLWQALKAIEHSVNTAGKILSKGKFESTGQWAQALADDAATRRSRKGRVTEKFRIDLETPYTFFSHYGDPGKAIFRMLRDAQDHQQIMVEEVAEAVQKIVDRKQVKAWEKDVHEFVTERGETLVLTTAQCMEIHELMKRQQAHDHLTKGGIVQPEIKSRKIKRGTDAILLTGEDLAEIVDVLTDEQVKVADQLQELTTSLLAGYGNEASMKAYGYKKFTGTDYWPIKSAREAVHSNIEKGGNNSRSIKNIGLAKNVVPHASNPLDIGGIFQTFASHAGDMTDYAAWLCPMEDAQRLYNYRFKDAEGNQTGKTIKGLLDRVGGKGAQQYWHNLMEDIQNGLAAGSDSAFLGPINKVVGNVKGAAVGANLRVIIQQPTSILRASAILNPADMLAGMAVGGGWKKALEHSPIAMRKAMGGFDVSSPMQMNEILFDQKKGIQRFNDAMMAGAAKADAVTWGRIWNACEAATRRKRKDLPKKSREFYEETSRLFAEVIDQSQVVDGVLQRSQTMRSNNAILKQATSFMGEPTMAMNMLLRAYDGMVSQQDSKKRGAAIKTFGRTAVVLLVTNVVNSLAQSLVDAERDDDGNKKYWERFRSAFTGITGEEETAWDKAVAAVLGGNLGNSLNPVGYVPVAKDLLSILQGYNVTRADADVMGDIITATQAFIDSLGEDGRKTLPYTTMNMAKQIGKAFGISAANILRDVWGIMRSIAVETGNVVVQYEMEKAIYNLNSSGNTSRFVDILYRAYETDQDDYEYIYNNMVSSGMDPEKIQKGMEQRMKDAAGVTSADELEQRYLDPKLEKEYKASFGVISANPLWGQATEDQKAKARNRLYEITTETGNSASAIEKIQEGADVNLTEADYVLYKLALEMADQPNENGNYGTYTNAEIEEAISMLGFSREKSSYLWTAQGKNPKSNPWG